MIRRLQIQDLFLMANTKTTRCFPAQWIVKTDLNRVRQMSEAATNPGPKVEDVTNKGAVPTADTGGAGSASKSKRSGGKARVTR